MMNQGRQHTPVIPALRRLRQEDPEFQASTSHNNNNTNSNSHSSNNKNKEKGKTRASRFNEDAKQASVLASGWAKDWEEFSQAGPLQL